MLQAAALTRKATVDLVAAGGGEVVILVILLCWPECARLCHLCHDWRSEHPARFQLRLGALRQLALLLQSSGSRAPPLSNNSSKA
eukprot:scaffold518_cov388-Prasinococcus_capsulatus_cf.AAC.2